LGRQILSVDLQVQGKSPAACGSTNEFQSLAGVPATAVIRQHEHLVDERLVATELEAKPKQTAT
jgi:hypothetical protein